MKKIKVILILLVTLFLTLSTSCMKTTTSAVDNSNDQNDIDIAAQDSDLDSLLTDEDQTEEEPKRIVAIGDIHGDLAILRRALITAGAINEADEWIGKELTIIQTGDILDRGDYDLEVIELLEKLKIEALEAGGKIHTLAGNHELMNVQLDLRYATEAANKSFVDQKGLTREEAFKPGGPFALILSTYPAILKQDKMIFVHGGAKSEHFVYGIDKLNEELSEWMKGNSSILHRYITESDGALWLRDYSQDTGEEECEQLTQALKAADAEVMIVGHSVQSDLGYKINSACSGKVWRIDTGMSAYYGGKLEVLEITGNTFTPLSGEQTFKIISSK